jgi:hypothetical protein
VIAIDSRQLEHVDSVELKFAVPDGEYAVAMAALGIEPLTVEARQVYYVDTPDLALLAQGVVLRARRRQSGDHDTAVKLRPVVPAEFPQDLRESSGFTIELDVAQGMSVYTATLNCTRTAGTLEAALGGERPIQELFSKRQRALLSDRGPGQMDWPSLRALGPVEVFKVTTAVRRLGLRVVGRFRRFPDGSSFLELSTRVSPHDVEEGSARLWMFLTELGFDGYTPGRFPVAWS